MAKRVRVKHIGKGYEALQRGARAQRDLEARAGRIAAGTGDPRIVAESSEPIRKRNRAAVIALGGDPDNKIIRALDAGR